MTMNNDNDDKVCTRYYYESIFVVIEQCDIKISVQYR